MSPFKHIITAANTPDGIAFVFVNWDGKNLSLESVVGPQANGNCVGACGQSKPDAKWRAVNGVDLEKLKEVWDRWHLNDMQAGSPEQEAFLRANPVDVAYPITHYEAATAALTAAGLSPDANGYKYGHAWGHEDVPHDVLEWLHALGDSGRVTCPARWLK